MDVSPCNPLFDLRLDTQVLSKTLNCSASKIKEFKGRCFQPAFYFIGKFKSAHPLFAKTSLPCLPAGRQ